MEDAKYPVTPTKHRHSRFKESCMENSIKNSQNNHGSPKSTKTLSPSVEEWLSSSKNEFAKRKGRNDILHWTNKKLYWKNQDLRSENMALKASIDQLTVGCDKLSLKSHSGRKRNNITKASTTHDENHGFNVDEVAMESIESGIDVKHHEVAAFKDLKNQVNSLQAQTTDLREKLTTLRVDYHSLKKWCKAQDAKLKKSFQDLAIPRSEAQVLRNQLQALQKEMLSQVPKVEAVSDEVFSREFQKLVSLVKSLSRSVQPAHGSDIIAILGTGKLPFGVAKHHWNTRVHKKAYIEAWVWSFLIVTVFDKPFGFCKKAMSLNEDWILMFGKDHKDDWPIPTPESENWRFITSKRLVGQIGPATVTSGQVHKEYSQLEGKAKDLQKSVLETREDIANIIGMNLMALNPKTDLSHITDIVNQAFTLAVTMAGQLCRIQIAWPEIGQEFETRCMSSIPDRSGQDIDRGVVASIVHPGLTRWGNENGQKFEGFHEIVPSLVQLEPAATKHEVSNGHVNIKQEPEKTFRWTSSY